MYKSVLITGSSRGIGLAIAKEFFNAGYNVCLNCINNIEMMEKEIDTLNLLGKKNRAVGFCADISDYISCGSLVKQAEAEFSGIDVLINNAAISYVGLFTEMSFLDYYKIINTNLISAMNMSHLVLPKMISAHSGCIINISSIWGERGASCEAAYSTSKGGLNSFTKSLAKELGPSGIRVNAISCGVIDTDMNEWLDPIEKSDLINQIALSRLGSASEIAKAVLFLASNNASYITGAILSADGGM